MADNIEKLKAEIRHIVEERRLCSCMNDTKWAELRNAMMNEMPSQPPFSVKFLTDEAPCKEEYGWYEAYVYEGLFCGAFALEWLKIKRGYKDIADADITAILKKYSIPYEEENGAYCIYGYS